MHSILDSILRSIFGRFLLPTSTPENQLNASRLAFSCFSAFKVDINFGSHFGTNLGPFWYPKNSKIHPKNDSKRHQKNDRFLNRFFGHPGSILTPKLGPCWPLFRLKRGDAVRSSPVFWRVGVFLWFFRRLDPILASFWLHFGPPGPHLGSIWEVFGYMLAPFWRYVGPFERKSWHWMRWSGGATRSVKISVFWW